MHLFLQLLLALFVASFIFLIQKNKKKASQPPGPPGLPVIGNLHQCASTTPHLYFHELCKTYGPLMSLKLGFVPTLVVSSAKMAKEVLKTHDNVFASRPKLLNQQKLFYNGLSITLLPYGDHWREIRKACIVHLFSPKRVQSFSSIREDEVYQMTREISCLGNKKKPVNLSEMMICVINTIVCRVAFGRREEVDNAKYRSNLQVMLRVIQELLVSFSFSDYFPLMGWVDKIRRLMHPQFNKVSMELDGLLEEIIDEHVKTKSSREEEEDIVDVLLRLQRQNSFGFDINRDHIKATLMDLFVAGTDTAAGTIVWAMTELMRNPKAMKQLQEEARTTLMGKDTIKEADLGKLVYLKAVVKETLRLHPAAPLLVPREANQSCIIDGYQIKKKTLVYVNAYAIGRDPEAWENPDEFRPERFLCGKQFDFRGQDFDYIPFGSGRRVCPGMNLGIAMVELALANLTCLFDWDVPAGMENDVFDSRYLPGLAALKKIPLCLLARDVGC